MDEQASIKILLLGAGECGKSTILKQMKILHSGGFTPDEMEEKVPVIRKNTVESMYSLITACQNFGISFEDPKADSFAAEVVRVYTDPHTQWETLTGIGTQLQYLWKNESIQIVLRERCSEFFLLDSAPYFLRSIDRCFSEDYEPTDQDIVRSRVATIGIHEFDFVVDKKSFKLVDVGGQRGERKKWIHCFQDVKAIMFIASLSEYDQVLTEDHTRNRMQESLKLFQGIINLSWFKDTPIILFLNKHDIFLQKILKVDMQIYFPEFIGGDDPQEAGALFVREKYFEKNDNPTKDIYAHLTNATDTGHFAAVWNFTRHIVLQDNLGKAGLVLF
mmetsp:Transcript_26204/g.37237  ORF Transcript_26204/g.37237 Transcript_26204/m.37237 type:complete len:332 (+) Transcript_26204:135-1130(+)